MFHLICRRGTTQTTSAAYDNSDTNDNTQHQTKFDIFRSFADSRGVKERSHRHQSVSVMKSPKRSFVRLWWCGVTEETYRIQLDLALKRKNFCINRMWSIGYSTVHSTISETNWTIHQGDTETEKERKKGRGREGETHVSLWMPNKAQ